LRSDWSWTWARLRVSRRKSDPGADSIDSSGRLPPHRIAALSPQRPDRPRTSSRAA
jgi:hypothetical protein